MTDDRNRRRRFYVGWFGGSLLGMAIFAAVTGEFSVASVIGFLLGGAIGAAIHWTFSSALTK